MLSVDEAIERILVHATPVGTRVVPLAEANGRILAVPVVAASDQPPFAASAMDGYAVRAEDVRAGAVLELVGESQAGAGLQGKVASGQCVRIFTGAPMPEGADSVVMQELATAKGKAIAFAESARIGQSVRKRGNDFATGEELIATGTRLGPAAISLIAAANQAQVSVHKRPGVALLATGDELVAPGTELAEGQIVASNSWGLSALFSSIAGDVHDLGIAPDNETALAESLQRAFDTGAEVIVTTGGASVGDHDLVQPVLQSLGVEIDFWKMAMRPGKPLMFGTKGHRLVFGLPGNPVSALVTATVAVLPALRQMAGLAEPRWRPMRLPLAAAIPANGPRRHFLRGNMVLDDEGTPAAMPLTETDSAHLSSLAGADLLIVQREDSPALEKDALVEVIPLNTVWP